MVELERRGVPTVSWTAAHFVADARRSARHFGLPHLPLAVMPLPFTNQPPERIRAMVDEAWPQVVAGLTQPVADEPVPEPRVQPAEVLTFEGSDLLAAAAQMQQQFLAEGWSDGLPLLPPTPQAVEAMLKGTTLSPDTVVATLEPGFGLATVEKLAINAVMAGCQPPHLPVLIAAVRCLAEPRMYLRNKAMSTGPHAPLLLVNGPLAKTLRLNAGCCALGPGAPSYANTVIGRAVRLIMMNVGHTYPGVSDMDTIGSPLKYSLCVAENVDDSPWPPYHVEKGFDAETSTVTVQFVYGMCELHDFSSTTPERLAAVFCTAITNVAQVGTGLWLIGRRADPRYGVEEKEHNLLLVCPEHARLFAEAGWSKARLRQHLYAKARLPFETLMLNKEAQAFALAHPELQWLHDSPQTLLPVVEDPECFDIAVVGGAAGRGAYFYGAGAPVTKPIEP
ncbi:MAG: hypothetical protein KatS3mg131_0891 [Candidatus Tectimicrobiota bacterium]|nr:MAG: hypothetical protein KatS3mg131_0891 [Candidatus Tectomicrobia bacterium]